MHERLELRGCGEAARVGDRMTGLAHAHALEAAWRRAVVTARPAASCSPSTASAARAISTEALPTATSTTLPAAERVRDAAHLEPAAAKPELLPHERSRLGRAQSGRQQSGGRGAQLRAARVQ